MPPLAAPSTRFAGPGWVLRDWLDADAEAFAAINADPEVMRHYPAPLDARESRALMERFRAHARAHGYTMWALAEAGTGRCIGSVGLYRVDFAAPFTPAVEVGWKVARSHWNRGLATAAARAAVGHAFGALALRDLVAFTSEGNAASRRVMEKLGFTRDPGEDFDHPKVPPGSPLRRHVLYRLRAR